MGKKARNAGKKKAKAKAKPQASASVRSEQVVVAPPRDDAPAVVRLAAAGDATGVAGLLASEPGIDVDARDVTGTGLCWAAIKGHAGVCRMLLDAGADPNAANEAGLNPVAFAVLGEGRSHLEVLELLLERGARDQAGADGMTGLMAAAMMGEGRAALLLLKNDAAQLSATTDGMDAASMAELNGHGELAKMLRTWGSGASNSTAGGELPVARFYAYPDAAEPSEQLRTRAAALVDQLLQSGPARLAPLDGTPVTDDDELCAAAERVEPVGLWQAVCTMFQEEAYEVSTERHHEWCGYSLGQFVVSTVLRGDRHRSDGGGLSGLC